MLRQDARVRDKILVFFFAGRGRHTRCALVTGVQTCALPISSPARLYREWRAKRLTHLRDLEARRDPSHLERLVAPALRTMPIVTVIDGASHALAFLGGCLGTRVVPLGVDRLIGRASCMVRGCECVCVLGVADY